MSEFVRVLRVTPLDGFKAEFLFTNQARRIIDLEPYLHGGVFEPIRKDPALFRAMYVDCGTITWPGSVDIDPDVLYYNLTPARWETEPMMRPGIAEASPEESKSS